MNADKNILFIIPDERKIYEEINVKVGAFHLPSLSFAILAAIAKNNGYNPVILDLTLYDCPEKEILNKIEELSPEYIGFTCTSASYYLVLESAKQIKDINKDIKIFIGGVHVSSTVEETLNTGLFDFVFTGESEITFDEFLKCKDLYQINGIAFKDKEGEIFKSSNNCFLKNLDEFPFPDYSLYDLSQYHVAPLQAKNNPVVWIETSRGCPFDCKICNKVVHGQTFRPKSPQRVISEIKYFLSLGVKEFHIADDGFTSNIERAEKICDLILKEKLKFTWSCVNGIRVDRINHDLLKKMKKAGCYRISFGIESGNQSVLDNLGKKVTLAQIESAVKLAKKVGLEVFGFFMFGFEDDTEQTMQDTIDFAKKLPLDLAKASLIIPFPGCPLYEKYMELNLLRPTGDYRDFNVYKSPRLVYRHPILDWDIIEEYQQKFYRSFYFNLGYIWRRFIYSIKNKTLLMDIKLALQMNWFGKKEANVEEH